MSIDDPRTHYPRSKDELLRDFTVAARLHEIRNADSLRERLMPKWWESLIILVQFSSALGLLVSLMLLPALRGNDQARLAMFWLALMILSLTMGFEIVLFRLHHLRRASQVSLRAVEDFERRLAKLELQHESAQDGAAESSEKARNGQPVGAAN